MAVIDCRFCGGERQVSSSLNICLGCGSPAANAKARKPRKTAKRRCPACNVSDYRTTSDGSFLCHSCGAEFEDVEVSYCDDNPEYNAQKREKFGMAAGGSR